MTRQAMSIRIFFLSLALTLAGCATQTPAPMPHDVPAEVPPRSTNQTKCLTPAKATVKASKPFVTVSYVEPSTNAKGQPLTNLSKTTIYHDLGGGLVKYKDIPATNPQGGGTIKEKILFTLSSEETIQAIICVTATNTNGQES